MRGIASSSDKKSLLEEDFPRSYWRSYSGRKVPIALPAHRKTGPLENPVASGVFVTGRARAEAEGGMMILKIHSDQPGAQTSCLSRDGVATRSERLRRAARGAYKKNFFESRPRTLWPNVI